MAHPKNNGGGGWPTCCKAFPRLQNRLHGLAPAQGHVLPYEQPRHMTHCPFKTKMQAFSSNTSQRTCLAA